MDLFQNWGGSNIYEEELDLLLGFLASCHICMEGQQLDVCGIGSMMMYFWWQLDGQPN